MVGYDTSFRVKLKYTFFGNLGLWSSNMFLLKQKLPVEVADQLVDTQQVIKPLLVFFCF